jgi:hypothetical protein
MSSRSKRERYTQDDLDEMTRKIFGLGYTCGQGDERKKHEHRDDLLMRLVDASEEGPEALDALAREVGAMPDDGLGPVVDEQLVAEVEAYLREQE